MGILTAPKEMVYGAFQSLHSAWLRRKHRAAFDGVECFCLFVGYPRSGHSIVGALLNAHRDAVIAHELIAAPLILKGCTRDDLYSRILARAVWFNVRGNIANYKYQIPRQWQGRFQTLRVIGDKRGGTVSRVILDHPDFLQRVRDLTGVPLRIVHVVRNPFDNISAISTWHGMPLDEAIDFYFEHCKATSMLETLCDPGEVMTVRHEEMIRDARSILTSLCGYLGLECYPGYLDDCCSVVFNKPTYSRRKVTWTDAQIRNVEDRARPLPFLKGYEYAIPGEVGSHAVDGPDAISK